MNNGKTRSIYIDNELAQQVYAMATAERRSFSEMLSVLVAEALAAREGAK